MTAVALRGAVASVFQRGQRECMSGEGGRYHNLRRLVVGLVVVSVWWRWKRGRRLRWVVRRVGL